MSKKVAYVTGGMGGIGTAICQRLHKEGFTVIAGCGPTRDHAKWIAEQAALGYTFHASVGNVGGAEFNHYGIGGSYTAGPFSVGASYEYTDFDDSSLGNIQGYGVVLGFDVTPNTTLRGTWGRFDWDKVLDDNLDTWGLGVEHRLSKRTMVYAEYLDSDMPFYVGQFNERGGKYATVGMRHDF